MSVGTKAAASFKRSTYAAVGGDCDAGDFPKQLSDGATTWLMAGLVLSFVVTIQLYARKRRLDKERQAIASGDQVLQNS